MLAEVPPHDAAAAVVFLSATMPSAARSADWQKDERSRREFSELATCLARFSTFRGVRNVLLRHNL